MRCDHLQSPVCGRHSQIITPTPSNPDSLNVWEWVAEELAPGAGGQGSGSLLDLLSIHPSSGQVTAPPLASVVLSDSLTARWVGDPKRSPRAYFMNCRLWDLP